MTITIPIWTLLAVAIPVVWWAIGFAFNSFVLGPIAHRHMRGSIPRWYESGAYFTIGPVGWAAYLYDKIDHYRRHHQS